MAKYNGSVELISGITPANGQDFPLVAAHAVQVDDNGTRLDEALKNVSTDIRKGKHRQVGKACLWYHNLYDWGNTDDEAAANLAQNDIVVAGGNLYANAGTKEDRTRQLNIITKAKTANPNLKLFFYITIASWRKDGDWSHILGKGGYWDAEEAAKHPGAVRIHTKWEIFQLLEYAAHVGGSKNGNEENIVIRGEEPSNSFLQICRVTEAKLAKDKKLIGNALYITDSGTIMITDFNGVKVDIAGSVYAGAVSAGYTDSPSKFGMDLYELIRKKQ